VAQTIPTEPYARGQKEGWTQSLERLAEYVESEMEHGRRK
jgi:hypothetical protein